MSKASSSSQRGEFKGTWQYTCSGQYKKVIMTSVIVQTIVHMGTADAQQYHNLEKDKDLMWWLPGSPQPQHDHTLILATERSFTSEEWAPYLIR